MVSRISAYRAIALLLFGEALAMTFGLMLARTAPASNELMQLHRGGTLELRAKAPEGTVDPQINESLQFWQLFYISYDGLVAFRKAAGAQGGGLVPDLAEALPKIEHDGRSYVFKLRSGVKFSDGREVTVRDTVASFRRLFKVSSPNAGTWYRVIVGAEACLARRESCSLDGGVVGDESAGTVTINLTQVDPEFLFKLAAPFAAVLPADSPAKDVGTAPLPGTGPYVIASYDPNTRMDLRRNSHFTAWSTEAQPDGYVDRIVYRYGLDEEAEVTAVEHGQADWMFDRIPQDRLGEIGTRFASQVHISPVFAIYYVPLNTRIPPFDHLQARQALNFAINRRSLVNLFGGPKLAIASCQIQPPGFPGYEPYCPYTRNPGRAWSAPDLEKAKQLVKESGTAGQKVTVVTGDGSLERGIGSYLQSVLSDIGYEAALKTVSNNIEFTYIQNTNNRVQMSLSYWYQEYPAASDFLRNLFSCGSFRPASDSSLNISGFCDPRIDAQMAVALQTASKDPAAADELWATIDREITDVAPAAVLFVPRGLDFVSRRVGNFVYSGQYQWILSKAWVQ